MMFWHFLYLVLYFLFHISLGQDTDPVIDTVYGSVRGSVKTSRDGLTYEEYLGVPFAQPPLESLRWKKPLPPVPWEGIRDAKSYALQCTQFRHYNDSTEDCLYLNVFVPGRNRSGDNLPVLMYVHGGGYIFGEPSLAVGYDLALYGDVIVVVPSYRLGTLGWMSTEDEASPGNYGLWDIKRSLEWIQDNVALFGGDSNSVTVFGMSAGGAMVSHLMISPETNTLFHRGIAMSGHSVGFIGVALPGSAEISTTTLARTLGCRRLNGSQEVVDCLREQDARDLDFWGIVSVVAARRQLYNWMPVIDGEFVPQNPLLSWEQGAGSHLDYMTGNTYHDSAAFVLMSSGAPNDSLNLAQTETLLNISATFVTNHFPGDSEEIVTAIYDEYPAMYSEDLSTRTEGTVQSSTHGIFQTWSHLEALEHSRRSASTKTFLYNYRYHHSFLEYPFPWVNGTHANDNWSVFGPEYKKDFLENILGKSFNQDDFEMNDRQSTYFINFARNGDPNIGLSVDMEWPQYDDSDRSYMQLSNPPEVKKEDEELLEKYDFWVNDFKSIALPEEDRVINNINDLQDEEEFENSIEEAIDIVFMMFQNYAAFENNEQQFEMSLEYIEQAIENRNRRLQLE